MDRPGGRQVPDRVARRVARRNDPDRPHDVLDRPDDRKKERWSTRVISAAVWSRDCDEGADPVCRGKPVGERSIRDDTTHRMRHDVHRGVVATDAAYLVRQDLSVPVDAAIGVVGKPGISPESPHDIAVGRKARRKVVERAVVDPRAVAANEQDELLLLCRRTQRLGGRNEVGLGRAHGRRLDLTRPQFGERDGARGRRMAAAGRRRRPAIVRARRESSSRKEGQCDERTSNDRAPEHAAQSTGDRAHGA